jgi:hypothetical protein
MPRKRSSKLVRRSDEFDYEMGWFDADMERDEALDLNETLRDQELIRQWLAPQKGKHQ